MTDWRERDWCFNWSLLIKSKEKEKIGIEMTGWKEQERFGLVIKNLKEKEENWDWNDWLEKKARLVLLLIFGYKNVEEKKWLMRGEHKTDGYEIWRKMRRKEKKVRLVLLLIFGYKKSKWKKQEKREWNDRLEKKVRIV